MKTSLNFSGPATLVLPNGTKVKGFGKLNVSTQDDIASGSGTFKTSSLANFNIYKLAAPSKLKFDDGVSTKVIITKANLPMLHFATTGPLLQERARRTSGDPGAGH